MLNGFFVRLSRITNCSSWTTDVTECINALDERVPIPAAPSETS
ncbi:hypothetical protein BURMUCGD1_4723 [Burkholderia multivorans CGD1]|nr:hypothetical protein BURMUCGD1_4723 [Burkholderia multivorans CGD1]